MVAFSKPPAAHVMATVRGTILGAAFCCA